VSRQTNSVPGAGLEPREVSFACAVMFCMTLAFAVLQVTGTPGGSAAVRTEHVGADFAEFYVAGKILNEYGAASLYDLDLQTRLFRSLEPGNKDSSLWYVCAPHLAAIFRPFALLPYRAAFLAWWVVSILIFGVGLCALGPYLRCLPEPHRKAAILLGLSFAPFALWSFVGGQIGAIAFAIIAWCVRFDLSGKHVAAGATLALCCYKPSLLLLFGPFLLVRMNLRLLLGFGAGLGGIFAFSTLAAGPKAVSDWLALMSTYGRFSSGGTTPWPAAWPLLIDLNHFVRRIVGSDQHLPVLVAGAAFVAVVLALARHWRGFDKATAEERQITWAVTITASLVANLYVMTYDSVSLVSGAVLTAAVLCRRGQEVMPARRFHAIVALVWVTALVPPPVIAFLRVHVYTLAIVALAVFQYGLLRRLSRLRTES